MLELITASLPSIPKLRSGKVRDIFEVGDKLLIVSTDRISAFDVVLPNPIPGKGRVLTGLSVFWFNRFGPKVRHHLVTADLNEMPTVCKAYADQLKGRAMLVLKASPLAVECVVRGYLVGTGWREYQDTGEVCGIRLPPGLKLCDKLPEPIFTPSTKAAHGHDQNIDFQTVIGIVGHDVAMEIRELSLYLYQLAAEYALTKGIIIADTKFEFGLVGEQVVLIDEVLTPDSSRFWPADSYEPGRSQASFDKQYVRDYLESVQWNKAPPAPELPADVVKRTSEKYFDAYYRIVGSELG